MQVDSPQQVVTEREWKNRAIDYDYDAGTHEAPITIYNGPAGTCLGPALIVEPWPLDEQLKRGRMSRAEIRGDESHRNGCASGAYTLSIERGSCSTCALLGFRYYPCEDEGALPAPNHGAWARIYVQAKEPIPRAWLPAFVAALNDAENERFRDALRRDVATHGYRVTNEAPGYKLPRPAAAGLLAYLKDRHGPDDHAAIVAELREIVAGDGEQPNDYDPAAQRVARRLLGEIAGEEVGADA